MSMTDAQFREVVQRDAVRAGWPADVGSEQRGNVGRPQRPDARRGPQQRRGPVGHAPAVLDHEREIRSLLSMCKLPATLQEDLRAARVLTFQAARSLCASVVNSANPKLALERLRLHLFTKARHA